MTMRARFSAVTPDSVEFSIQITMTLAEWRSLGNELAVAMEKCRLHDAKTPRATDMMKLVQRVHSKIEGQLSTHWESTPYIDNEAKP